MTTTAQHQRRTSAIFALLALALGGCSESATATKDDFVIRPIPSFQATKAVAQELFQSQIGVTGTNEAQFPKKGTATYEGAVGYRYAGSDIVDIKYPNYERLFVDDPDYVSRIRLVANFGSSTVSGSLGSFRDRFNDPYTANATINGAIGFNKGVGVFDGTIEGTNEIINDSDAYEEKEFSGSITGQFLGGSASTVLGHVFIPKGLTGEEFYNLFGVYTAVE